MPGVTRPMGDQATQQIVILASPQACFDVAAAFGRSTAYTLRYHYGDAPGQLRWVEVEGDITSKLDGAYQFVGRDRDTSTEVTYHLEAELPIPLPGFVKRRAAAKITHTALRELKARVERSGSA